MIEGSGWSNPFEIKPEDKENCLYYSETLWNNHNQKNLKKNPKKRLLKGNYVGFHSWWSNNYGHILHDNLPLLAYLKATLNESYKFIMLNSPVVKNIIKALDKNFYNRIEWIETGEIITVDGNLIVPTPDHYPCIMVNNLMSYFLEWSSNLLPKPLERNKIIFYTRRDTTKFRVLNSENEKKIVDSLKNFLTDNKVDGELIIFSGNDENGNTLPIDEQMSIFRSAHTIIGPHGTGLINIMWCDFDNDSPIKLLEFCPGPVGYSSQVQQEFNGYHNVLRGLPLDYHIVLYEPRSTPEETFVSLEDFSMAISEMILK
jgi:capsular polysaccharide biosynthesis protein